MIDVGSGGAVAVDPSELRTLAAQLDGDAARLGDLAREIGGVAHLLGDVLAAVEGLHACASTVAADAASAGDIARAMRFAADTYEMVELQARALMEQQDADARGPLAELLRMRQEQLEQRSPGAGEEAERLLSAWRAEHGGEFLRQIDRGPGWLLGMFGLSAPLMFAPVPFIIQGLRRARTGRIPDGTSLRGRAPEPVMRPGARGEPGRAPLSFGDLASRVPDGDDATIRVERYTLADGRREFAVYVAGTQGESGTVLDWDSNVRLYSGERSQAYAAVERALEEAGAQPGDVLHAAGFSQGGMIAGWLAAEGRYDVQTLVTLGAPMELDTRSDTVVVTVRHDDDPFPLLVGGGAPHAPGSDRSVLIERTLDPASTPFDVAIPAHRLEAYIETMRSFDASGDPRVAALGERLAHLQEAPTVEVFDFRPEKSPERSAREGGGAF